MKRDIIVLISILIISTIIVSGCFEEDYGPGLEKMRYNDPNHGFLVLDYELYSDAFWGSIGPILDDDDKPLSGVEVKLFINDMVIRSLTNNIGIAYFNIAKDIVETIDLKNEYKITLTKEGYEDRTWNVKIQKQYNQEQSNLKVFRVFCGNSDNVTHKVILNIFDENNTEIDNLTDFMEPEKSKELYRKVLPDQEYLVKVYVDNNWNGSIKHSPQSVSGSTPGSWISLNLGKNGHGIFIKYIM